ncbi:MAG: DNA-deoxyinosine glycosylase [Clostridiales bacterium]|nr:DNA-deoxyinosine glycosylase [Clostridiales bacterium]
MRQIHPIPPVYDAHSTVLILGSFPSVKSRETGFFYGHAQNRFWRVTAAVFGCPVPATIPEKRAFLLGNRIALWDVLAACDIDGSADASIRDVCPNDLAPILAAAPITRIFTNGAAADALYTHWQLPIVGIPAVRLPSTSPANAAWSLERLIDAWRVIR